MDIKTIGARNALLVISLAGILLAAILPGIAGAQVTEPSTTISLRGTQGSNGWFTTDVTVSLNATDSSRLGINRTEYSYNGSAYGWIPYTGPFNVTKEDMTAVYYRSVDNASIVESTKWVLVNIDKTPPTITYTLTPAPNADGWSNQNVQVHFDVSDDVSGIASRTHDTNLTNEGTYSGLVGTATDLAGNTASVTIPTLGIDRTPPALGPLTLQGNAYAGEYMPVSASLVETNPARTEWDWGDGSGMTASVSNNVARGSHDYQQPGVYKITLTAVDKAGSTARSSANVTIYGTVPTALPTATPMPAPTATPTPTPVPLPSPTATPAPALTPLMIGLALIAGALLVAIAGKK